MKLVFMGTPDFALSTLKALLDSDAHEICLVVTQPDKPKGRGKKLLPPAVKQMALEHELRVIQPTTLKSNTDVYQALRACAADAVIVVAYGKMIPSEMFPLARHGFINVHASLLPAFRGAAPINRAILNGCSTTGVSIMRIDEGMDSGPVYLQSALEIAENEDVIEVSYKLAHLGAENLLECLYRIEYESLQAKEQDHTRATLAPMLRKEEGNIDWSSPPRSIHNMIRGFVPWPCAYTFIEDKLLKLKKAHYMIKDHDYTFGTLFREGKDIKIACNGGFIIPEILQLEGKKAIDNKAFACGLKQTDIILGKSEEIEL